MKKTTFTDTMIRKLKPADKKIIRGEGNGFSIRVMPSGTKTWLYAYAIDGRRREMLLGNYPEVSLETARKKFEDARRMMKNGVDPMAAQEEARQARRKAPTINDLVDEYLERHARRFKRSWAKDEQILNREVIPEWGKRKAADITKREVIHLLEGIVHRGAPAMANNTFQIVRKMFNYAVEKDILQHTPCAGVKLPAPKKHRERVLSEAEIKILFTSLDRADLRMTEDIRRALKLILVTAQRPGEVSRMHSREIDGKWWTIPSEKSKNGKVHRVFLTDFALELLGPLETTDPETGKTIPKGHIFPTPIKKKAQPIGDTALAVALGRNLAYPLMDHKGNPLYTEEGKPATENRLGVEHFTSHDLRRTAATFMAQAGELDEVIDAVLNHSKSGVIKVYNQYRYDREKQLALEAWERKLKSIVSGKKNPVIPLQRKKRL